MKNIGFTKEEIDNVLDIVIGILKLGNLEFETQTMQGQGDASVIAKSSLVTLEQVANLFKIK